MTYYNHFVEVGNYYLGINNGLVWNKRPYISIYYDKPDFNNPYNGKTAKSSLTIHFFKWEIKFRWR